MTLNRQYITKDKCKSYEEVVLEGEFKGAIRMRAEIFHLLSSAQMEACFKDEMSRNAILFRVNSMPAIERDELL